MSEKAATPPANISAQQLRKIKKPLIERRRRERINDSLNQLKALVLDALNKDESRYSKMEKADILEMTVRHLKAVQRQVPVLPPSDQHNHVRANPVDLIGKYQAGFNECASEVSRYLSSVQGVGADVQMRLLQHLSDRFQCSMTNVRPQVHSQAQIPLLTTTAFQPQQQPSPTATPITALPGQLSINTSASSPCTLSPTLPSGSSTATSTATPVIAVVSPANLTSSSSMLRNAIPLYVTQAPTVNLQETKAVLVSTPPSSHTTTAKPSDSRTASSPQLGDEVPNQFHQLKASATSPVATCTKSHNLNTGLYAHLPPKTELCSPYPVQEYASKSVWRPW